MKTITLDEEAYARLKGWKQGGNDSFSRVVKRVVPKAGTAASFLRFTETRKTDQLPGNEALEAAVSAASSAKADPWSS
jgi:predicted CopG family antitoxin